MNGIESAKARYEELLDSYKRQTPLYSGAISTEADVAQANSVVKRFEKQLENSVGWRPPPVRHANNATLQQLGRQLGHYGGKKRRSRTTRRMRMKKTKRAQQTRRR